jgi:hypothetical protein
MATIPVYFPDDESELVLKAAAAANQKPSPYAAEAIRERLRREGHIPGTVTHDVRTEALAAAEIAGPERVLAALRSLRQERAA